MKKQRYPARTQLVLEAQEHVRRLKVDIKRELRLMAFEMREWGWTEAAHDQAPVKVGGLSLSMAA